MSAFFVDLPRDLTRRYRYGIKSYLRHGIWAVSYELVGASGALVLNVHNYSSRDDGWSAGLELHRRTCPDDGPPSHDFCPVLNGPCWHDGSSSAAEKYIEMALEGNHGGVLRCMILDADDRFAPGDWS